MRQNDEHPTQKLVFSEKGELCNFHAFGPDCRAVFSVWPFRQRRDSMHEFGTNPLTGHPIPIWRRLTPATSLCTVVLLGWGGWAHFSSRPSDDSIAAARPTPDRASTRAEFGVTTIQNEIDDADLGRVTTASASVAGGPQMTTAQTAKAMPRP